MTTELIRRTDALGYEVVENGVKIGFIYPSDRRWVKGWVVVNIDGKELGDQPRRVDAVASLVAYATSPFRKTP